MPTIAEIKAEVDEHYATLADQPPQTPAQIEACKALIYLFTVTFKYHMYDETAKLVSEDYIQHNEDLGTGRQSIIDFAESRTKGVYWYMRFKRIIVDGEYVGGQLHVKSSPEDEGVRVFELLRYKNGVFVEHWDVMQPIKPASERKNPIGVF
ncbi:hypothetical protein LY78DRAFT_593961 [Colletotrichum sublineola]|uniref:SnoaL-like domain-containing protein n=1 Tax=Colletotrichum sublineola TaxID=1173701 RepID=A0A066XWM3_COLSU|nr:hypothetical protein LY78DRAFT_593961 [Colletotrichum sublineola]KDN70365.1 hypothetical protein CSUB01_11012 [Colletotrichum sublineola]